MNAFPTESLMIVISGALSKTYEQECAMKSRKKLSRKSKEGIKMLKRRYAKWKEKQSLGDRMDCEEIHGLEPGELDPEEKLHWS